MGTVAIKYNFSGLPTRPPTSQLVDFGAAVATLPSLCKILKSITSIVGPRPELNMADFDVSILAVVNWQKADCSDANPAACAGGIKTVSTADAMLAFLSGAPVVANEILLNPLRADAAGCAAYAADAAGALASQSPPIVRALPDEAALGAYFQLPIDTTAGGFQIAYAVRLPVPANAVAPSEADCKAYVLAATKRVTDAFSAGADKPVGVATARLRRLDAASDAADVAAAGKEAADAIVPLFVESITDTSAKAAADAAVRASLFNAPASAQFAAAVEPVAYGTAPNAQPASDAVGLSGGAVAGIVIGLVAVAGLVAIGAVVHQRRERSRFKALTKPSVSRSTYVHVVNPINSAAGATRVSDAFSSPGSPSLNARSFAPTHVSGGRGSRV